MTLSSHFVTVLLFSVAYTAKMDEQVYGPLVNLDDSPNDVSSGCGESPMEGVLEEKEKDRETNEIEHQESSEVMETAVDPENGATSAKEDGEKVNEQDEKRWTPLHRAAHYGLKEVIESLLTSGANVNERDHEGWTPLHYAARYGHKEVAELLLSSRADVYLMDKHGWRPVDLAICYRHKELVHLLGGWSGASSANYHTDLTKSIDFFWSSDY